MTDEITQKQVFSYSFVTLRLSNLFNKKIFCCCRRRFTKQDWMQRDAENKLSKELDVLEVIKQLRISKFMSEIVLEKRQKALVKFFREYTLDGTPKDKKD